MGSFAQGALLTQLTSTATSGSTTTLTASSTSWHRFTGVANETVVLPDATTMKVGRFFKIQNRSTGTLTVNFNGGALAALIATGTEREFDLFDNSSSAGDWTITNQVDIDAPLALHATRPTPDEYLNITSNQIYNSDGSISSVAPSDDVLTVYDDTTIAWQQGNATGDTTGGTLTTQGGTFTRPSVTVSEYVRMAMVYQSSSNNVDTIFSTAQAVRGNLTNPGTLFASLSGTPMGYVDLQSTGTGTFNFKSADATTNVIKNDAIVRFSSGAGGGAGGDTSFKVQSVGSDGSTKIKGGHIALSNSKVIATYDGSGSAETDFGKDITIDLDNLIASPVNSTTYYLYVDKYSLNTTPTVMSDSGRELYPVIESNFTVSTTPFEDSDKNRYLGIGVARYATGAWSTSVALTYPAKREALPGVIASPVVYSGNTTTIGEVGITSGTTQGHLVDGLFPTLANVHYYHLDSVDTGNDSSGNAPAINLVASGTPSYVGRGLFGDSVVKLDGINQYYRSTDAFFNPVASGSFSYGIWAKISQSDSPGQSLMANMNTVSDLGFLLSYTSTSFIARCTNSAAAWDTVLTVNKVVPDNTWHHFAVVFDFSTTTLKFYIDGALASYNSSAAQRSVTSSRFTIGCNNTLVAGQLTDGYIQDAFFVKGNALTDAQVLAIYSKKYANDQIAAGHVLAATSFPSYISSSNISWYNLTSTSTVNDGSANARNFTPSGSPVYTGIGVLGLSNSCVYMNGSSYLYSTNAHFDPDDSDFTCGGWFKSNSWATTTQGLFSQYNNAGAYRCFQLTNTATGLELRATIDGLSGSASSLYITASLLGWQHITLKHTHSNNTLTVFLNGTVVGTLTLSAPLWLAGAAGRYFTVGSSNTSSLFTGYVDEFFFISGTALSADEIAKIYSYKLSHNKGLSPLVQSWSSLVTLDDITIPADGVINDLDSNDLYLDLSGQNPMSSLKLILQNADPTGAVSAVSSLRKEATATAIDSSLPITHNLPGKPTTMELWVEISGGYYEQHDPATYFKVNDTTIATTGTTLASVLGGSTNCILIAACGAAAVYSGSASSWTTSIVSSTYTASSGEELITDSTGGVFTITLPSSPSIGSRVKFIDSKGTWNTNNVTVGRNSKKIGNASADLVLDVAYGWCELVYDGVDDWKIIG